MTLQYPVRVSKPPPLNIYFYWFHCNANIKAKTIWTNSFYFYAMKQLLFYLLLSCPSYLIAQNAGTKIRKVYVSFTYSRNIFPESWRGAPISATGRQMDMKEIPRCKVIIARALSKYPEMILKNNLTLQPDTFVGEEITAICNIWKP